MPWMKAAAGASICEETRYHALSGGGSGKTLVIKRAEIGEAIHETHTVRRTVSMTLEMSSDFSPVEVMSVYVGPFWDHVGEVGRAFNGPGPGIGLLKCEKLERAGSPSLLVAERSVAGWVGDVSAFDEKVGHVVAKLRELGYSVEGPR